MIQSFDVKTEFYNANASKAYPLSQSTGGEPGTLPCGLLVDAYLLVDCVDNVDSGTFYISKIEVTSTGFMLSISYEDENSNIVDFDRVGYCAFSNSTNCEISFSGYAEDITIAGKFVVGDPLLVKNYPPVTEFTKTNGALSPLVVKSVNGLFITAIKIGDTLLTGDVTIEAGQGIEFEITGNTVTVTNTKYSLSGGTIYSDAELVQAALSVYGLPIRSINGVCPDSNGNINIVVPTAEDSSNYYVSVTSSDQQSGALVISIAKNPCIAEDTVATLMDNIEQLNFRASRLDAGITALDNQLNNISIQLQRQ